MLLLVPGWVGVGLGGRGQRGPAVGEGVSCPGPQAFAVAVLQGVLWLLLVARAAVVGEVVHVLPPVHRGRLHAVTLAWSAAPVPPRPAPVRPLGGPEEVRALAPGLGGAVAVPEGLGAAVVGGVRGVLLGAPAVLGLGAADRGLLGGRGRGAGAWTHGPRGNGFRFQQCLC